MLHAFLCYSKVPHWDTENKMETTLVYRAYSGIMKPQCNPNINPSLWVIRAGNRQLVSRSTIRHTCSGRGNLLYSVALSMKCQPVHIIVVSIFFSIIFIYLLDTTVISSFFSIIPKG